MSSHKKSNTFDILGVFEERAEHLSEKELNDWTALTSREYQILEKLKGPGAKLLSGPRGSGKSTLLKTAYYDLAKKKKNVFGVYVNFSKSLALEPLFHTSGNAAQIFRQWVLAKILKGVGEAFEERGECSDVMSDYVKKGEDLVQILEVGALGDEFDVVITPSRLLAQLEELCKSKSFNRVVLFFDDAAHAFSLEQQRDFFEIFRELRSRKVSAKAAIYPGITSFSPNFHVGHEAEVLTVWYRPDQSEYLEFMRDIFNRRLPDEYKKAFEGSEDVVDLLALASTGLPRGFLNLLSDCLEIGVDEIKKPTRQNATNAIKDYSDTTDRIFSSLSSKLPRFRSFIEVGKELEESIVRSLRDFNRDKIDSKKAVVVAIADPVPQEVDKILKFFEYAGVLQKRSPISRGVKGTFQRYLVNYSLMISDNALSLGKSVSTAKLVDVLKTRDAHSFVRVRASGLLEGDISERCVLDLPPCSNCGAPRVNEEQKFCMNCGSELSGASVYHDLLNAPIDELPLTRKKLEGIKNHTAIRRVQDVLADDDQQVLKVPSIGKVWASRIRTYAEEFVSV